MILKLKKSNTYWFSILRSYELFTIIAHVASYWLRDIFYRLYESKDKQKTKCKHTVMHYLEKLFFCECFLNKWMNKFYQPDKLSII